MGQGSEVHSEEVEAEAIELDRYEAQPRILSRRMNIIVALVAISLSLFQLYTSWRGAYNNFIQRPVHLAFVFAILFATYPPRKKSKKKNQVLWIDWVLILFAVICSVWVIVNGDRFVEYPGESTTLDLVFGGVMALVVLEGARRVLGPVLPIMAILAILYALFGNYVPGQLGHRGFSARLVIENMYTSSLGIWGLITGLSASLIAGFLIFGVLLQKTGGGETFVDLAVRIAGRSHGGPAKVSCFSSAFFGSISGSAIANVVVDGVFNIPLMKSMGYRKDFAAAVEATASAGGQIVPPIMGAGAFIMAELLGIPYIRVAAGAAIPAALFYLGIYTAIHFQARMMQAKPLTPDMIPSFRKKILPRCVPFVLPVAVLVYLLSVGYSPSLTVLYSVLISVGYHLVTARNKATFAMRVKQIVAALDAGGRTIVMVACLCACAQMLVGIFNMAGLGVKLTQMVINLFSGHTFLILVSGMVISVILGMGIPTTAAYVLCAAVVAPAITTLGGEPLRAHLFIFYFAVIAAITPPVCGAVYVASAIAGSVWWKSAWMASRLGLSGFIIPYMLYYAPTLLLYGDPVHIIMNSITAGLGVIALSATVMGYLRRRLSWLERLLLFVSAILLIHAVFLTDFLGVLILGGIYVCQRFNLIPKRKVAPSQIEREFSSD